jgi:anti-sigma regulatory factor (Ser/Thr protein kinase)
VIALRRGAGAVGASVALLLTTESEGGASVRDDRGEAVALDRRERQLLLGSGDEPAPATPAHKARFVVEGGLVAGHEAASWAALPLDERGGRRALVFGFRAVRSFHPDDRALLVTLAEQVGAALERAEAFEAERGGRRRAEQLQALAAELAVAERPGQVSAALSGPARLLLGAASCVVAMIEPGDTNLLLTWRSGPAGALPAERGRAEEADLPASLRRALRGGPPAVTPATADWSLDAAGRVVGAVHYEFTTPLGERARGDVALTLAAVAALSGQALGRTGRSAFEHEVAVTLQRSMLPAGIDTFADLDLAAAYRPAVERMEVGGDWYDVLPLDDGRLALVVGDVVGRGLPAATAMGRLRHATRALRFVGGPAELLSRLDPVAAEEASTRFTTVACVVVDLGRGTATYATAGHPPPVLRHEDGAVETLDAANALPLGIRTGVRRPEATAALPVGSALLLYSDGLVERRGESIDRGLGRLRDLLAGAGDRSPRQVVDRAVASLLPAGAHHDDVVLLYAWRLPPGSLQYRFAGRPSGLAAARQALDRWLEQQGLGQTERDGLVLAAGEALSNAVEHGHGGDGRPVDLTAWRHAGDVWARVSDQGTWPLDAASSPTGGRGLPIMVALTDKVVIERGDPPRVSGTTVTLCRALRP